MVKNTAQCVIDKAQHPTVVTTTQSEYRHRLKHTLTVELSLYFLRTKFERLELSQPMVFLFLLVLLFLTSVYILFFFVSQSFALCVSVIVLCDHSHAYKHTHTDTFIHPKKETHIYTSLYICISVCCDCVYIVFFWKREINHQVH